MKHRKSWIGMVGPVLFIAATSAEAWATPPAAAPPATGGASAAAKAERGVKLTKFYPTHMGWHPYNADNNRQMYGTKFIVEAKVKISQKLGKQIVRAGQADSLIEDVKKVVRDATPKASYSQELISSDYNLNGRTYVYPAYATRVEAKLVRPILGIGRYKIKLQEVEGMVTAGYAGPEENPAAFNRSWATAGEQTESIRSALKTKLPSIVVQRANAKK